MEARITYDKYSIVVYLFFGAAPPPLKLRTFLPRKQIEYHMKIPELWSGGIRMVLRRDYARVIDICHVSAPLSKIPRLVTFPVTEVRRVHGLCDIPVFWSCSSQFFYPADFFYPHNNLFDPPKLSIAYAPVI